MSSRQESPSKNRKQFPPLPKAAVDGGPGSVAFASVPNAPSKSVSLQGQTDDKKKGALRGY
jgi:hypothetical protein